jgi:EAL domain-containing protein (putative c-di-GMP-specific phosphodiesterase class I)
MANALGFKTIAEGIEEKQQEDYLKGLGCMQGQGYLYARPLDEEAFEAFLIANSTVHKI